MKISYYYVAEDTQKKVEITVYQMNGQQSTEIINSIFIENSKVSFNINSVQMSQKLDGFVLVYMLIGHIYIV